MVDKKSYYAIIPATVRYHEKLTPNAKLLYGEITALCNEKGYCWASNKYFADLYKADKSTVSKWISQLRKNDFIKVEIKYKSGTKEIEYRYMRIQEHPMDKITYRVSTKSNRPYGENRVDPMDEITKDNTTLFNNTFNTTSKSVSDKSSKGLSFDAFWKLYDKGVDKQKCKSKWTKIPKRDREIIFKSLPEYVRLTPNKKFRKNPLTYLNGKNWTDDLEILNSDKKSHIDPYAKYKKQ